MNAYEKWIAFSTIVRRELRRIFRIWIQTFLPIIITTVLYFLIFGQIIGTRIGTMEGVSYIQYISPGLVMLSIINSSYSATVAAFFSAKFQRSIEELLISPISSFLMLLGFMVGGVLRGLLVGMIVATIASFFTHVHIFSYLYALIIAVVAAAIFSLGGIINAIFANKFDDIAIIPTFILTPLTYLGGVFYSLKLLPSHWRLISEINPIFYIIDAFRYSFLGLYHSSVLISFSVMVFCLALLFLTGLFLLRQGIGIKS